MPAKSNVATSLVLKKKVEQERKSRQAAPERSNVPGKPIRIFEAQFFKIYKPSTLSPGTFRETKFFLPRSFRIYDQQRSASC